MPTPARAPRICLVTTCKERTDQANPLAHFCRPHWWMVPPALRAETRKALEAGDVEASVTCLTKARQHVDMRLAQQRAFNV